MRRKVLIIGAGVVGSMVARRFAMDETFGEIVIVDTGPHATGASLYSAGVHFPFGSKPETRAMTIESQAELEQMQAQSGVDFFRPLAMTVCGGDGKTIDENWFTQPLHPQDGLGGRLATRIKPRGPVFRADGAHVADVPAFVRHVRKNLPPQVTQLSGLHMTDWGTGRDRVAVSFSCGERIEADLVILAVGPWARSGAIGPVGELFGVRIKRVVALHLEDAPTASDPLIFMPTEDLFVLPQPNEGRWLFSYTSTIWDVEPDALPRGITQDDLETGRAILERICPTLAGSIRSGRAFCDAYSPDRVPLTQRHPHDPRIIFAGACNGSGYRLSPAIADRVHRLATSN